MKQPRDLFIRVDIIYYREPLSIFAAKNKGLHQRLSAPRRGGDVDALHLGRSKNVAWTYGEDRTRTVGFMIFNNR